MTPKARTFCGGPIDGVLIEQSDWEYATHCFDMGENRLAIYEQTDAGFQFERMVDADTFNAEIADVPATDIHQQF